MKKVTILATVVLLTALSAFAGGGEKSCSANKVAKTASYNMSSDANAQEYVSAVVAKYANKGWLGIEGEPVDKEGVYFTRIKRVVDNSPAYAAGFQSGDVLFAIDGVKMLKANKAEIKAAKSGMTPGAVMTFHVKRNGEAVKLTATLDRAPDDVMAAWVGKHMLSAHAESTKATATAMK